MAQRQNTIFMHTSKMYAIQQLSIAALLLLMPLVQGQSLAVLESLSSLPLNTTSPTEDYINENQRQYAALMLSQETQMAEFKSSYELQIQTIDKQSAFIESKLQELDARLNPLEVLSELTKHCVQKYRSEVVSIKTIKASLTSCVSSANSAWNSIISTVDSTRRSLVTYVNSNLKTALTNCDRKFSNATMNYTLCVTDAIGAANTYAINVRKSFSSQLTTAKCTANTRIETAVECGFSALYSVITGVGAVTRSIDTCILQLTECAACATQAPQQPCDELYSSDDRFVKDATRQNPFYKSNSTAPCAIVRYDFNLAV